MQRSVILPAALLAFTMSASFDLQLTRADEATVVNWWDDAVEQNLALAGENRDQLIAALTRVPESQREEMAFLIANMPEHDAKALTAEFLLDNVRLATTVMEEVPWADQIPRDVFLNDILPYASIDEPRDPWRAEMRERFLASVKDCRTPGEAAHRLNSTIFKELSVRYSTQRRRANQSPKESIEQGMCSCTGLSILLIDACRACGVPARLTGIPMWVNKRGNHTWVEVWDDGWHFTGAAEANANGLDHTWFQGDAALAQADSRMHSIYSVSYRRTDTTFPMVWDMDNTSVSAVNVTSRYTPDLPTKSGMTRLMVRVFDADGKSRVAADVAIAVSGDEESGMQSGRSKDESADTNDILTFEVPKEHTVDVTVSLGDRVVTREVRTEKQPQVMVELSLPQ